MDKIAKKTLNEKLKLPFIVALIRCADSGYRNVPSLYNCRWRNGRIH